MSFRCGGDRTAARRCRSLNGVGFLTLVKDRMVLPEAGYGVQPDSPKLTVDLATMSTIEPAAAAMYEAADATDDDSAPAAKPPSMLQRRARSSGASVLSATQCSTSTSCTRLP